MESRLLVRFPPNPDDFQYQSARTGWQSSSSLRKWIIARDSTVWVNFDYIVMPVFPIFSNITVAIWSSRSLSSRAHTTVPPKL